MSGFDDVKKRLVGIVQNEHIRVDEPMAKHSSFRAGGSASLFVEISSVYELLHIIPILDEAGMPYIVIGNATNILFRDEGYKGAVLKLCGEFEEIRSDYNYITAGAAALLSRVARIAETQCLTGFEFAAGIPGSVGGAMVMNAGAYGSEMKDIVESVICVNLEEDTPKTITLFKRDMEFGYRNSIIKKKNYIVTEVTFKLYPGDKESIRFNMENLSKKRRDKQPLEYPSAGSTFKRPDGFFAGALIEQAGLKGFSIGDAQVSEKHAGFVINRGNATASDIIAVIEYVRKKVYEMSDVMLETEVIIV